MVKLNPDRLPKIGTQAIIVSTSSNGNLHEKSGFPVSLSKQIKHFVKHEKPQEGDTLLMETSTDTQKSGLKWVGIIVTTNLVSEMPDENTVIECLDNIFQKLIDRNIPNVTITHVFSIYNRLKIEQQIERICLVVGKFEDRIHIYLN